MPAIVGQVYRLVRANVDAVGAWILTLAPGTQEIAIAVEHHHRVIPAVEHVHVVVRIDPDRADLLERPAVRQLRPLLDYPVSEVAAADRNRHLPLPLPVSLPYPAERIGGLRTRQSA